MMSKSRRQLAGVAATLGLLAGTSGVAQAFSSLNLIQDFPDIAVNALSVSYDSGTDALLISSVGSSSFFYAPDSDPANLQSFDNGNYEISATVNSAGELQSGGTFSFTGVLGGNIVGLGGELTAFGGNVDSDVLEFLFDITTNTPSLGFGSRGGVIIGLAGLDLTASSFTNSFNNNGAGIGTTSADNFAVVPEPSVLGLMLAGGGLLVLGRYRARRSG